MKYPDFGDAIICCLQEGSLCYLSKSDHKSAFRNLGILRKHWRYLIMKARSPIDGKIYYFVDKCLPFGASISCAHFQKVSDAIAYLVEWRTSKKVLNYLDDYVFLAFLKRLCNMQIQVFLKICAEIRMPVAPEKTVLVTTVITFLGFLIDTVNQFIAILVKKISKAINMIEFILQKPTKTPKSK